MVREQILACILCFLWKPPKRNIFSSLCNYELISHDGSHFKSSCDQEPLLSHYAPKTSLHPNLTLLHLSRCYQTPVLSPAGAPLHVLGLLCLSAAATLSLTRRLRLALFSPVLFRVLDSKAGVSAVGSGSDRSQSELPVSCDGAGSQTSPLEQALPFMPCPTFSPPKLFLWQAAASP